MNLHMPPFFMNFPNTCFGRWGDIIFTSFDFFRGVIRIVELLRFGKSAFWSEDRSKVNIDI